MYKYFTSKLNRKGLTTRKAFVTKPRQISNSAASRHPLCERAVLQRLCTNSPVPLFPLSIFSTERLMIYNKNVTYTLYDTNTIKKPNMKKKKSIYKWSICEILASRWVYLQRTEQKLVFEYDWIWEDIMQHNFRNDKV